MESINEDMLQLLVETGLVETDMTWAARVAVVVAMLLLIFIINVLFTRVIMPAVHRLTASTKAKWDDYLFSREMLRGFCRVIDPILVYIMLPLAFGDMPQLMGILNKVCEVYLVVVTLLLLNTFLNMLYKMSNEHEHLRNRPLKGVYQMIKLVSVCVGAIVAIAIMMDSDATSILAGLGASAAVLMLIFKDSILGLVAGVQLSANDMLRPGDWGQRICRGSVTDDGEGAQLRQDRYHHTAVCPCERFVPELAWHVGHRGAAHNALDIYRHHYSEVLHCRRVCGLGGRRTCRQ